MVAAHLRDAGQLDRLASLFLGVTVLDQGQDGGIVSALADEHTAKLAVAASASRGYLDGRSLAEVFAWLRPNDLIWSYWVNNYLRAEQPPPFDILYWNADTTRMPAALHRDFIDVIMGGSLAKPGAATMLGSPVDLSAVDVDAYVLAGARRPPVPVAVVLPVRAAARRRHPVRPVDERAHRIHGQPARQPQGPVPG